MLIYDNGLKLVSYHRLAFFSLYYFLSFYIVIFFKFYNKKRNVKLPIFMETGCGKVRPSGVPPL